MIKGVRVQAVNTGAGVGVMTASPNICTAVALLTVPTGKTFVMTDLVVDWTGVDNMTSGNTVPGVAFADVAMAGGTAFTASTMKFAAKQKMYQVGITTGCIQTLVLTNIENGPEFSTCVAVSNLSSLAVIPTWGIFMGGILR